MNIKWPLPYFETCAGESISLHVRGSELGSVCRCSLEQAGLPRGCLQIDPKVKDVKPKHGSHVDLIRRVVVCEV